MASINCNKTIGRFSITEGETPNATLGACAPEAKEKKIGRFLITNVIGNRSESKRNPTVFHVTDISGNETYKIGRFYVSTVTE
jgi:hypothetical protein